jgi:2-polyprenyl-3-methyl-5-hydroxy-6-metoxy-1,4-benzoquinol methylase
MEYTRTNPIRAAHFLNELRIKLQSAQGTFIYDACLRASLEKTNPEDSSGYVRWLQALFDFFQQENGAGLRTLDLGCGTGELTVLMELLGFEATGIDLQTEDIRLARLLAQENGLSADMFVRHEGRSLPFADHSFDIVMMISVLEHLDDQTLDALLPELARICRGILFVQAPSSASFRDDHTGLRFVPAMPHWLARTYIAARGSKYRYSISSSGIWDVHYRSVDEILHRFRPWFEGSFAPANCAYPEPSSDDSVTRIGKHLHLAHRDFFIGVPLPWRRLRINRGYPKEAYYPYVNLIFKPAGRERENGFAS